MTKTQNTVLNYCNENGLVIIGWNYYDKAIGDIVVVEDMPQGLEEWKGACAHVSNNEKGITLVHSFYTSKNIKDSYLRLRVRANNKWLNVKR